MPAAAPAGGRRAAAPAWGWAGAYLTAELRHRPWAQHWRGCVWGGMGKGQELRTGAGLGGHACARARRGWMSALALAQPTQCACCNAAICNK